MTDFICKTLTILAHCILQPVFWSLGDALHWMGVKMYGIPTYPLGWRNRIRDREERRNRNDGGRKNSLQK